jgi:formylglycine-generating enzyme required for sulfatase activity
VEWEPEHRVELVPLDDCRQIRTLPEDRIVFSWICSRTETLLMVCAVMTMLAGAASQKDLSLDLGGGMTMELVRIPHGTFRMGSRDSDRDADKREKPVHQVTITRDYYLGKYLVTQEQYKKVMGKNPSSFSTTGVRKNLVIGADTRRFPVESVTWDEANEFCKKLSRATGRECALPTEAEWEYGCRAGTNTRYFCGDNADCLREFAWDMPQLVGLRGTPHEVGKKRPNPWGLHDMQGNVCQWCADWFQEDYYKKSPKDDPCCLIPSQSRVFRGGAWLHEPVNRRCASRGEGLPASRGFYTGFRVAVRLK